MKGEQLLKSDLDLERKTNTHYEGSKKEFWALLEKKLQRKMGRIMYKGYVWVIYIIMRGILQDGRMSEVFDTEQGVAKRCTVH